ncbi:MAG: ABC transporter ATP-binding protein/permease [Tannerellaceae bacterium]|jgi:ATP-binding cassette subfamily B protein/subfamily B ATP-binding cassette protein MsbA|nr:ABC transporter ATP-binding protein/permease [Tannerellaceae bacterium]
MKDFLHILRRFIPPYKRYLILNVVFNVLSAILNLFSFVLVIPILNILFKIEEKVYAFIPWQMQPGSWEWWKSLPALVKDNFYWYVSHLAESQGASFTLIILGLFLVGMTFLKVGAMYLSFFTMIPIRTGVVRDIRNQIMQKITRLPLGFFSEERKGDIIARVSGDVNEIETSIMSSLDMLFKNPILIAIYLVGMFIISWKLTLFVFILLPLAGYIMGKVGKTLKRQSLSGQQQWGYLMSQVEETLSGLRIIKAFNAEEKIRQRFRQSNEAFRKITGKIYMRQQLAHPMSEFLGTLTIAIVLWYGGSLILSAHSTIDAPTFIYYLVIFYSLINPAKDLSRASYAIQKGLASMQRIDKILLAGSNIKDPACPQKIALAREIAYNDVWFRYNDHWVLKGINLVIPKGQTIALVGQSGSGKSTLVDLLPRFYDANEGCITIDGTDIRHATLYNLRGLMGNVNQEAILFNDTFFNNIAFGVDNASPAAVEEAARIANAHDFIIACPEGYNTNIGDRGGKLSGGQRQRISIARAILKNPPILILDEATSALDTESERLVQQALEHLMQGRTTIIIAHRLSTIRRADRICVMHEGKIVEHGRHEDLLRLGGYYKKLCDMQNF